MKLWIDECLSPTLVRRANERDYWATCNRDRDLLGALDDDLYPTVLEADAVFITNNESDFVALCRDAGVHTGLVILPQTDRREAQWPLLDAALDHIEARAAAAGEAPGEWMVNRYVEVDLLGTAVDGDLP